MDLKWQDTEDIAIRLVEEHPGELVVVVLARVHQQLLDRVLPERGDHRPGPSLRHGRESSLPDSFPLEKQT